MIRRGTYADLPELCEMVVSFGKVHPLVSVEPRDTIDRLMDFLSRKDAAVIVSDEGALTGCILGVAYKAIFGPAYVATEVLWWVNPEARKGRTGLQLYQAFHDWAVGEGATMLQMAAAHTDQIGSIEKFYTRKGFTKVESHYVMRV